MYVTQRHMNTREHIDDATTLRTLLSARIPFKANRSRLVEKSEHFSIVNFIRCWGISVRGSKTNHFKIWLSFVDITTYVGHNLHFTIQ
jgi:hypothetical protein